MNYLSIILLALCLFLALPGYAAAEKWELLYEDRTLSFFVDADSIIADPDGSQISRDKFVFKKPQCDAPFALKETQCYHSVILTSKYFNNKSNCTLKGIFTFSDGFIREVNFACIPKSFELDSFGYLEGKYLFRSASQGTE